MLSVVHVYHRWQKSEIRCFVNGQQIDSAEMVWFCGATEVRPNFLIENLLNENLLIKNFSFISIFDRFFIFRIKI